MTNQEAFNKVWDHFVTNNGKPSLDFRGDCLFRGPNGTKCAVGVLIPDDIYDPAMDDPQEHSTIPHLLRNFPKAKELLRGISGDFLKDLQFAHDSAALQKADFGVRVRENLIMVAEAWCLTIPS